MYICRFLFKLSSCETLRAGTQTVYINFNVNKKYQSYNDLFPLSGGCHVGNKSTNTHSCPVTGIVYVHRALPLSPLSEQTMRNTYFQVVKLIKATKTILYS